MEENYMFWLAVVGLAMWAITKLRKGRSDDKTTAAEDILLKILDHAKEQMGNDKAAQLLNLALKNSGDSSAAKAVVAEVADKALERLEKDTGIDYSKIEVPDSDHPLAELAKQAVAKEAANAESRKTVTRVGKAVASIAKFFV